MRIVDDAALALLRVAIPPLEVSPGKFEDRVHDGQVAVDNSTKVVSYALPYVVYTSNFGDDNNPRAARMTRRSVFMPLTVVGLSRAQVKWALERIRVRFQGVRLEFEGHHSWPITLESSQRIRRDDNAIRPDGTPLFYGVDEYAAALTISRIPEEAGVAP